MLWNECRQLYNIYEPGCGKISSRFQQIHHQLNGDIHETDIFYVLFLVAALAKSYLARIYYAFLMLIQVLVDNLCFLLRCPYTPGLTLLHYYHLLLNFSIKKR